MLYSFIIFTYNRASFLPRSIGSILSLTGDYELIVVNDGSTDNTEEVVRSFPKNRVRYIHIPHAGAPAARNAGIEAAKGDFIIWCGDDDAVKPWILEEYSSALRIDPYLEFASGDLEIFEHQQKWIKEYRDCSIHPETVLGELLFTMQCCDGGSLFRKDLYTRFGKYNPSFPRAQDYEFFSRLFQCHPLRLRKISRPMCEYYLHGQGHLSSNLKGKDLRYDWAVIAPILDAYTLETLFPHMDTATNHGRAILLHRIAQRMQSLGWLERCIDYLHEAYAFAPDKHTFRILQDMTAQKVALLERLSVLQRKNATEELASNEISELQALERILVPLPIAALPVASEHRAYPVKNALPREEQTPLRLSRTTRHSQNKVESLSTLHCEKCCASERNALLEQATTEWVLLIDNGVSLTPGAKEKALDAIARYPDLNAVFLDQTKETQEANTLSIKLLETPPPLGAFMLRKQLWVDAGPFETTLLPAYPKYNFMVDWFFWIKASLSGLRYFLLPGGIEVHPSAQKPIPAWSSAFMGLLFHELHPTLSLLEKHNTLSEAAQSVSLLHHADNLMANSAAAHLVAGMCHEQAGQFKAAKAMYLEAVKLSEHKDWQPFLRLLLLSMALNNTTEAQNWATMCFMLCPELRSILTPTEEHA